MSNVLGKKIDADSRIPNIIGQKEILLKVISNSTEIKPFVKWAGGKTALLKDIRANYPKKLGKRINKYCEPFIGGGAVLFDILSNYKISEVYISDLNKELIGVYREIKNNAPELIKILREFEKAYIPLSDENRKTYYYARRDEYNDYISQSENEDVYGSALFIFLNRTCFNGLYRVNKRGLFNVPMGSYKNPKICDEKNLLNISKKLKDAKIVCASYDESIDFIDNNTFVYCDPPYRPLTKTANFTSYSNIAFNDKEQSKLAEYFHKVSDKGAVAILSNSDPKNINENDEFFDELYADFNIMRIKSKRRINSDATKRGDVSELLITNQKYE